MSKSPGQTKVSPARARTLENRAEALNLALAGANPTQIGDQLGFTRQHARNLLLGAIKDAADANIAKTEELRTLMMMKLAALEIKVNNALTRGEIDLLSAVRELRGIYQDASRLTGINAPVKQELTGKDGAALAHGVLVVSPPVTADEWEKAAQTSQGKLKGGD
jgi:hypothetical protein